MYPPPAPVSEGWRVSKRIACEDEVVLGSYLNNNLVYTTSKNNHRLHLYEPNTQTFTSSQEGHSQQIISLSTIVYNYNKRVLVTTSLDKTLIMW